MASVGTTRVCADGMFMAVMGGWRSTFVDVCGDIRYIGQRNRVHLNIDLAIETAELYK